MVEGLDRAVLGRDEHRVAPTVDGLPWPGQLDLLDALGGDEEGDLCRAAVSVVLLVSVVLVMVMSLVRRNGNDARDRRRCATTGPLPTACCAAHPGDVDAGGSAAHGPALRRDAQTAGTALVDAGIGAVVAEPLASALTLSSSLALADLHRGERVVVPVRPEQRMLFSNTSPP